MLFHMSIEAADPRQVAMVLGELWGGVATPFPPGPTGSWCALAEDDRNSMIVVFPRGTALVPSPGDAPGRAVRVTPRRRTATSMTIASDLDPESVLAIAQREQWPAKLRRQGEMVVAIELWLEGAQLVEVMTAEMQQIYLRTMTPDRWLAYLEKIDATVSAIADPHPRPAVPLRDRA